MSGANLRERLGGGLLMRATETKQARPLKMSAARSVDWSWLPKVKAGDDQGQTGSCTLQAIASWVEIMKGRKIPQKERLALYQRAVKELGRTTGDGLYVDEAIHYAKSAGWIGPNAKAVKRRDFVQLVKQPILMAYEVTPAWRDPSPEGCLDHAIKGASDGLHMVLGVGEGQINDNPQRAIYLENSWGWGWGWRGLCLLTHNLHNQLCVGMWTIENG